MSGSFESSPEPLDLLARLGSRQCLERAWQSVASKGGAAGIDRVTVSEFGCELEQNLERLSDEIRTRSYRPSPVVRIRPSFLAASDRALDRGGQYLGAAG